MLKNFLDNYILPFVFKTSNEPILFSQLLEANRLHSEGMIVEGNVLGFRLLIGRAYLVYILMWHFVIIPAALLLHSLLADLDSHVSILLAILFTAVFFATFSLFREWLMDSLSSKLIREAWSLHFPHFSYDLHAKEVAKIYARALRQGVAPKDMQLYILDKLVKAEA